MFSYPLILSLSCLSCPSCLIPPGNMLKYSMKTLPEEIEQYRDRKWRREEALKVETAQQVEEMVEDLGFCLGLTDARKSLPSVYIAVCGRRDAHMPRNVQKDPEASAAWVLKDEVIARGRMYYAKLVKGHSMFLAPRMVPYFNAIWGVPKSKEKDELSENARKVLKVLRKEWEMATADLRAECGFKVQNRPDKSDRRAAEKNEGRAAGGRLCAEIYVYLDAGRGPVSEGIGEKGDARRGRPRAGPVFSRDVRDDAARRLLARVRLLALGIRPGKSPVGGRGIRRAAGDRGLPGK